jgi:hypothetical protein
MRLESLSRRGVAARPDGVHGRVVAFESRALRPWLAAWSALTRDANPFVTAEFFRLTHAHLARGPALLACATRGASMVGALPLSLEGRTLTSLRTDHSPYDDVVGDSAALAAIWRALRAESGWDALILRGVPSGSLLLRELPALAAADGARFVAKLGTRSPYLPLVGFEARMDPKLRHNVRRLAGRIPGLAYERITRFDRAAIDEAYRIEASSWKGEVGTAIAQDRDVKRFYDALMRLHARRGELVVSFVTTDGRRVAMGLSVERGTTHYGVKIGIDPEMARWGVGQQWVHLAAGDAEARGLRTLDFLGTESEWKHHWTKLTTQRHTICVYPPSAGGLARWAWSERARPAGGKVVRRLAARFPVVGELLLPNAESLHRVHAPVRAAEEHGSVGHDG